MVTATATAIARPLPIYRPGRAPREGESYGDYLTDHRVLGSGFAIRELVRNTRRLDAPPSRLWANMVPTLVLANELRRRMIDRHEAHGLRVQAAFRKTGGAARSVHKINGALDLDLLPQDRHLAAHWYREATVLWCEVGEAFEAGLGLYCPAGRLSGVRVHIDTGTRDRTWQLSGRAYIRPAASIKIARRLELQPPTENDQ